jgi:H+-translocating NAD(P) transhydrogenase subunit alpha
MILFIPKETVAGERRVAIVPDLVPKLTGLGLEVVLEPGAGTAAGFVDAAYAEKGARLEAGALGKADIVLKVQPPSADEIARMKEGATLIGLLQPYTNGAGMTALAARNVTAFSMELLPRITRAQPMAWTSSAP